MDEAHQSAAVLSGRVTGVTGVRPGRVKRVVPQNWEGRAEVERLRRVGASLEA